MLTCLICHKPFKSITNSHLKRAHGISTSEYLEQYPDAVLNDEAAKEVYSATRHKRPPTPICAKPGCENRVSSTARTYCSYSCSSSHRLSYDGLGQQNGEKNHMYNGSGHRLGKRMKIKAKERDSYTCQRCGLEAKGKKMHAHHITPVAVFDDPRDAHTLKNLISLCNVCHKTVEHKITYVMFRKVLEYEEAHGVMGMSMDKILHSVLEPDVVEEIVLF